MQLSFQRVRSAPAEWLLAANPESLSFGNKVSSFSCLRKRVGTMIRLRVYACMHVRKSSLIKGTPHQTRIEQQR